MFLVSWKCYFWCVIVVTISKMTTTSQKHICRSDYNIIHYSLQYWSNLLKRSLFTGEQSELAFVCWLVLQQIQSTLLEAEEMVLAVRVASRVCQSKGRPRPAFHRLQHGKAGKAWFFSHMKWHNPKMAKFCRTNRQYFVSCSTDYILNACCVRQSPPTSYCRYMYMW